MVFQNLGTDLMLSLCSIRIKSIQDLCFGNGEGENKNGQAIVLDNPGHAAGHSPDSNGHVFLWLEVVITRVIQTLILWFFQVNEIGNPHCGGQRDGNQD